MVGQSGVDKRSYSSKNLPQWISKVSAWAQGRDARTTSFRTSWKSFGQPVLVERTKGRATPLCRSIRCLWR